MSVILTFCVVSMTKILTYSFQFHVFLKVSLTMSDLWFMKWLCVAWSSYHFDDLGQNCNNSVANALEILHSCNRRFEPMMTKIYKTLLSTHHSDLVPLVKWVCVLSCSEINLICVKYDYNRPFVQPGHTICKGYDISQINPRSALYLKCLHLTPLYVIFLIRIHKK